MIIIIILALARQIKSVDTSARFIRATETALCLPLLLLLLAGSLTWLAIHQYTCCFVVSL